MNKDFSEYFNTRFPYIYSIGLKFRKVKIIGSPTVYFQLTWISQKRNLVFTFTEYGTIAATQFQSPNYQRSLERKILQGVEIRTACILYVFV